MIPPACFYLCEHNACVIRQQDLDLLMPVISAKRPGSGPVMAFSGFRHPVKIEPPDSVTFHIWTAYSRSPQVQIVKDWMKTKGDTENVKPS